MKKIVVFLFFLPILCLSQSNYSHVASIRTELDFFTTDNQNNVYLVKKDELFKYNRSGKLLYKYSNKNLGDISFVDASNMLRVLVFYKDFAQVIFLDNTLSLHGEPISFDKMGLQQVALVCSSFNNGMWIYNQQNFSLMQLNVNYETVHQTENLSNVLNMELQPVKLLEHDNKVYLNNPLVGILIFDIYGTYHKTVPVKNAKDFQVIGDQIYYLTGNEIKAYNIKTTEEFVFNTPVKDFSAFRLEVKTLFLRTAEGIFMYTAE